MGCDAGEDDEFDEYEEFQSTHPHGVRRTKRQNADYITRRFQSTHPHGVRRGGDTGARDSGAHFNPRTHMGCDQVLAGNNIAGWISIHAPTWGATRKTRLPPRREVISIHAPTWGATSTLAIDVRSSYYFNPRTHMGCDAAELLRRIRSAADFNPRTHMGCDGGGWVSRRERQDFNPRTHMGCDFRA